MPKARTGDIVAFRPKGLAWALHPLSLAIKLFQGCPYTHTAILTDPVNMTIVEAYWPRVRIAHVCRSRWSDWTIYRPKDATAEQQHAAAGNAVALLGTKYDLAGVFAFVKLFLIERLLGIFVRDRVRVTDADGKLFCQELVTFAYERAGYPFAKTLGFQDPSAIAPKDVATRLDVFEVVETSAARWAG
jgi:hypothetical protein